MMLRSFSKHQIAVIFLVTVLLLVITVILIVFFENYAGLRSHTTDTSKPTVLYTVFEPAIVNTDYLIDYFRPSHLKEITCYFFANLAERLPLEFILSLAYQCSGHADS